VVSGFVSAPDGRHHGAHGAAAGRELGSTTTADFLDFSQNINPLGPPEGALRAAADALRSETGRYPDPDYPVLREALAGYLGVPGRDSLLPTNGGAEALFLAARVAADAAPEGRRGALVLEPTFSEYAAAARAAGFEPVRRVARRAENGFRFEPGTLDDLGGIGLVFLCNPNNPTGDALNREEVMEIADRVLAAGATLVVDEAFADFVPEVSVAADASRSGTRLLVARSFTKFFAVPGLRLGCLVSGDSARARAYQPSWSVNAVAAGAGTAAAGDSAFVRRTLSEVARLRAGLAEGLSRLPGLVVYPGAANYLLVRGPEGLVEALAYRGVLVRGCAPFWGLGPGYLRVAVRGEGENGRLLAALAEALAALGETAGVGS
jgi:threonine-phosphate decarboxylase